VLNIIRKIRRKLLSQNRFNKYLLYAAGEIFLVVVGIIIALQINNWNEDKKSQKAANYVLQEILNNLNEDASILEDILLQREKAKISVSNMISYLKEKEINKDTLSVDMLNFLTFERYFPINNGYEIFTSKGLELSNYALTNKISRYYNYEQKKMNRSIIDVEKAIIEILEDRTGISSFIETLDLREKLVLINYNDPVLKKDLYTEIMAFKNNNMGTIRVVRSFLKLNKELINDIKKELEK